MTTQTTWAAPRAPHELTGRVVVPGSKSQTNRALLLAATSNSDSVLDGVLRCRDSELMMAGLQALGARFSVPAPGRVLVRAPRILHHAVHPIECGLAGTVMRFLPALAATVAGRTQFVGDEAAARRPMDGLVTGLRQLGARCTYEPHDAGHSPHATLPLTVDAPARLGGPVVEIDSAQSSQFVSALLLAAPRCTHGIDLRHTGAALPSRPHIDMTCTMLARRGVRVEQPEPCRWVVHPGPVQGRDETIEPDLTNAAVFLAVAMVTGGSVEVPGWPRVTDQPGTIFLDMATRMGAIVNRCGDVVRVTGGELHGIDVDLHAASELTPVVAALGLLADGRTRIRGVAHIRGHETDRLAAVEDQFRTLGGDVSQTEDGVVITGCGQDGCPGAKGLTGGLVHTCADHRMAHALALVGLLVPGVVLDDVSCTTKTMPHFPAMWSHLVEGCP